MITYNNRNDYLILRQKESDKSLFKNESDEYKALKTSQKLFFESQILTKSDELRKSTTYIPIDLGKIRSNLGYKPCKNIQEVDYCSEFDLF